MNNIGREIRELFRSCRSLETVISQILFPKIYFFFSGEGPKCACAFFYDSEFILFFLFRLLILLWVINYAIVYLASIIRSCSIMVINKSYGRCYFFFFSFRNTRHDFLASCGSCFRFQEAVLLLRVNGFIFGSYVSIPVEFNISSSQDRDHALI